MKTVLQFISINRESQHKKNTDVESIFLNKFVISITSLFILLLFFSIKSYSQVQVTASVGTATTTYTTVKSAFDKINDGTHQGVITIKINSSTTETAAAVLNASGTGNANYVSVNMYPTASGLSISGDLSTSIIDFYGADNVTIDGSVNLGGTTASLTIININTYKYAYAIRFRQSAESNLIRYCNLRASSLGYGIVRFEGSSSGNGCDNNIIEYCDMTNSGTPIVRAIYSSGSDGRENSGNIIRYNKIYDFFNPGSSSYGISLGWKSTDWTITGNSLYQTTAIVPTGAYSYRVLDISQGDNNIISDNYIGGSAPQCGGGTAFTIEAMVPYYFCALYISGGTAGYVQNNVISNIKCLSTEDNPWDGMYINSGNVDVTGNTIGSGTNTGSIEISTPVAVATATISGGIVTSLTLLNGGSGYTDAAPPTVKIYLRESTTTATATATVSGGVITALTLTSGGSGYTSEPRVTFDEQANYSTSHGIIQNSNATVNITGNTIGSITTVGTDYYTHGFETVYVRGGPSVTNISNNIIGSETIANSIHTSSTAASSIVKQDLYAIYSSNNGTTTISGNIVANLTNAYVAANSGSYCRGIRTTEGINTIQNNTVRDMSISGSMGYSLIGIDQSSDIAGQTISGNEVYNLSNLTSSAIEVDVCGIFFRGPTSGTNTIDANFIHDLNITSTNISSSMIGIYFYLGYSTCSNNIINIGNSSLGYTVAGIWDDRGSNNVYFNTVYIEGSVSSGVTKNTAALWNQYNSYSRNYRNNILVNARTGGTSAKHYAISYRSTGGTFTADNNDYYVSGTGGVLGYYGGDITTLTLLQSATSQDANSLDISPSFTTAGGSSANDYVTSATLPGIAIAGVTTTYNGLIRSDPPKMGALEVSPNFIWLGTTSNDFATAANWADSAVPPDGASISFTASPTYDCYLDQARTLKDITNTSAKKLVLNAYQLTITGDLVSATTDQIDATNATVVFAGTAAQSISTGVFVSNTINALTLNNSNGLTQNGDIIVSTSYTLTNGEYSIGANTLTINGPIDITSGTLTGGISSDIVLGGSGANTTLPALTLNNLTINRANGISMGGSVSVAGTLALTDGTLTIGANTLNIAGNTLTVGSGQIDAINVSSTLEFINSTAITLNASLFTGDINNLTINGGGLTASSDLTINGILNLQSANQSATQGSLDMSTFTLNMGASSSTIGDGDVTGIVKRTHAFAQNMGYSFGSQYTTFTFIDSNTSPTWIAVQISIGAVSGWTYSPTSPDGQVKRLYKLACSNNSSTAQTNINMRYLLSELDATDNDESALVFWHKKNGINSGNPHEHGKSNQSLTSHFIGVIGLAFGTAVTTVLDESQVTMAYSVLTKNTWVGEFSTDWSDATNWSDGTVPTASDDVLIPGGLTNYPSLTANADLSTLEIKSGASVTANTYNITVSGSGGAWSNQGTFNPGTGTVTFSHGVSTEIMTISGTTNFYNAAIGANTSLEPLSGCVIRFEGSVTYTVSSRADWSIFNNTVEWNGTNQNILTPIGNSGSGYYNLIISGSGAKTMSSTVLTVNGDLTISGTAQVTGGSPITLLGDFTIGAGSSFNTGGKNHSIRGNFENNGILTASSSDIISMDGSSLQSIFWNSATSFENLTINNSAGVNIYTDATANYLLNVNNTLTLSSGSLNVGSNTLSINKNISRSSGFINVTPPSSLSFGGSTAITLNDDLFNGDATIENLIINNSAGVSLGNEDITANGTLDLIDGTLTIGANKLKLSGNSPTRTSGNIDASNASAEIAFNNSEAIIIPASIFSANVNNLTLNGIGGVTISDAITVNNILTLTNGIISTDANNILTLGSTATVSGGRNESFVNGPMTKEGTNSFVFPTGDNYIYAPIGITDPDAAFTAQYFNYINGNASSNLSATLAKVSQIEYWDLQAVTTGAVDNITLYFEDQTTSGITDPSDLRVANWTGTVWDDLGNDVSDNNYVKSSSVPSSYGPCTLGTIDNISNPLPVEIISFNSKCDDQKVILKWETATELNNDKFIVERSYNAEEWSSIANIKGAGNSNTVKSYEFTDLEPNSNANYYRLKQVDFNGESSYSKIISAECRFTSKGNINLYPNPAQDEVAISVSEEIIGSEYFISNNIGQYILSGNIDNELSKINLQELPSGVYIIIIKSKSGNVYKKKLVVN